MAERIEPIIVLNKIDVLLEHVNYDENAVYDHVNHIVKAVN